MDALLHGVEAGRSFTADGRAPVGDEVGIVKVSAVTWGAYDEGEAKAVREPERVNPAFFVKRGDLLFSRANTIELVGAAVIAERVERRTMLSDKILRLKMPEELRRWVLWVLRSRHGRSQIEALATGNQASMRNIGQDRIRVIAVPFPPLQEQHRIVAEVDRRLSVLDALEGTIDANLVLCARLRQAVLKRAFEGHLVGDFGAASDVAICRSASSASSAGERRAMRPEVS
jgi:type I restriction enzyme S subunit